MHMPRPFEGIFGNTCELRLLEFLLPLEGMEFNITELSEEVGVSRVTVGRVAKKFVAWKILNVNNRKIPRYSINPSSSVVKALETMNNALIARIIGEEKTKEIQDHLRKDAIKSHADEPEAFYPPSRQEDSIIAEIPEMTTGRHRSASR